MKTLWLSLVIAISFVQPMAKTQDLLEKKVVDIGDIRITATKKGVVAGRISTKKLVWRYGFTGLQYFPETMQIFEKHIYIHESDSLFWSGGRLLELSSGKTLKIGPIIEFYSKYNQYLYFNNLSIPYDVQDSIFTKIKVLEFDTLTQKTRNIEFDSDKNIDPQCKGNKVTTKRGVYSSFEFQKKISDTLIFLYSSENCDIEVWFDLVDTSKSLAKVRRK